MNQANERFIQDAEYYAKKCHDGTNHKYNGLPYDTHLKMVYDYGVKYAYLLPEDAELQYILAACWTHDVIEDCRQTYNDVKNVCGIVVAEITYALTNEKGKNRKERGNDKYYAGIKATPFAPYVKICDRLANAMYSHLTNSSMLNLYAQEQEEFKRRLFLPKCNEMFNELDIIVNAI